jgi:DNA mismatch repair protein MutL
MPAIETEETGDRALPWEPPRKDTVVAPNGAVAAAAPTQRPSFEPSPAEFGPTAVAPRTASLSVPRHEQSALGLGGAGAPAGATSGKFPPLRVVGQVGETYIVAEAPEGMYLVDQHAAHERVVYERLMRAHSAQPLERQNLLMPMTVDLAPSMATLLGGHLDELAAWGFDLDAAGDGTLTVRAVPAGLREGEVGPSLLELGEYLQQAGGSTPADWREQALTTIACHSAIRAGQTLSHEEMRQLLQQLERCAMPRTCPHGRPTTLTLTQTQLERQFGRKG